MIVKIIIISKTVTIHDYEYYHNSYMVSVSDFQFIINMIEGKGTCSSELLSMSDYLYW